MATGPADAHRCDVVKTVSESPMTMRAYPHYRDSGVEWLGEVPEHWAVKKLKYVASTNDEALTHGEDPLRPISYVDIGSVDATRGIVQTEELVFEDAPSRARRLVRDGDTIVSTVRTYLRAIAAIHSPRPEVVVSTGFAVIRPFDLDPSFCSWALRENGFVDEVVAESVGVSYPAINASEIGELPVPLPPLDEQRFIAAFLYRETERIDALVEKKRLLIERLEEYRTALITRTVTRGLPPEAARAAGLEPSPRLKASGVEWLGDVPEHWEVKALKWETPVLRGASPRPIDDDVFFDDAGSHAWVRIADVTAAGMFLTRTTQRLSDLGVSLSVPLKPGEIFVSIAGSVGKACITKINCCIHDGFVYFPRWSGDTRYLHYVFASGEPYKGLGKLGTQLNLNTDTVGSIRVAIPPVHEQAAIAKFLANENAAIESSLESAGRAVHRLQEYRTALITAAVTGKIDVREQMADEEAGTDGAQSRLT